MRHLLLIFAIGCGGGGTSGEPLMGTVSITVGDSKPKLAVGAAVQDTESPGKMLVQLGSDNIDCGTNLDAGEEDPGSGTFIYFTVDKAPATATTSITVLRLSRTHASLNSSSGSVTVDAADPRVAGQITFATTDSDDGMILVAGTFDVKRCF